jgi:antitoxin PrlF
MNYRVTSKLSSRSQTTIPKTVRDALDLRSGDRVEYVIDGDAVRLVKVKEAPHHDPALEPFLAMLQRDMIAMPEHIVGFSAELLERVTALTVGVPVDHRAPIIGNVAV